MKKILVLLVSVVLLAGLLVSCNPNASVDKKAIVKLDVAAEASKSLSSAIDYADPSTLTWYYKATTNSTVFNYGAKSEWTALDLGSSEIELSQGIWNFELKAVVFDALSDADAIYSGSLSGLEIRATESPIEITVPVFVNMIGNGYLALNDISIILRDGSEATVDANKAKVNGQEITLPVSEPLTLAAGAYDVDVWFVDTDGIIKAEETITVTIYGGATTTISGNLSEITQDVVIGGEINGSYSDVTPSVSAPIIKTEAIEGVSDAVKATEEAAVSNGTLTVKIPADTVLLIEDGVSAGALKTGFEAVEDANIEIATVENAKTFELTLNVSQENETLVEVSCNVGAGLDISKVFHNDVELPNVAPAEGEYYNYDEVTGRLTLYIYHASYITILEGNYASNIDELNALIASVEDGATIGLVNDITSNGIIVINKPLTLDGNGRTITSTAARAINIDGADGVIIKNLTVLASGERAFNIINGSTNVTIENVKASAGNYAVMIPYTSPNAVVTVMDSDLSGLNTFNIAGAYSVTTIENSKISSLGNNASEGYGALAITHWAEGASIVATDCEIIVEGNSIEAFVAAENATILIDGSDDGVEYHVAVIDYGDYAYTFTTLEEAVEYVKVGETISLFRDVVLDKPVVIGSDKDFTLDLNGHTISYSSANAGDAMITNNGKLTIMDSDDSGAKITYEYTGEADSSYGKGNYTIYNNGELTLTSGVVENTTAAMSHASYAINTGAGATLIIDGGQVLNLNGHAIRQVSFGTGTNNVTINGGYIEGTRAIWVQLPGSATAAAPEMSLTVNGGELVSNEETYNLAIYVYSYGQSAEKLSIKLNGGIFDGNVMLDPNSGSSMEDGSLVVSGGTFNCKYGIYNYAEKPEVIKIEEATFLVDSDVALYYALSNVDSNSKINVILTDDIELPADTTIVAKGGQNIKIDLNGKTLSGTNTRTATHNFMFDANGGVISVENGTVTLEHTGANMGWNGATTMFDVTAGGVLNMENVVAKFLGGTDMNFVVHLNNWGEVTLNADGCVFDAPYCGIRVFNSGYDKNNVTVKNSTIKGNNRAFWVHNYIGDLDSAKHSDDAINARLNLDIFGNNNEFVLASAATSPIRYGFGATVYVDENGAFIN